MADLRVDSVGAYYGSTFNDSEPLNLEEMTTNAICIQNYFIKNLWSINAICAMLGNMQAESTINPGRWQSEDVGNTSMGYGLVQWTPATNFIDWCNKNGYSDPSKMEANLARITHEMLYGEQWIPKGEYTMTFKKFSMSTLPVATLAKAFLLCYERPKDQSASVQSYRASLAEYWYQVLTGELPNQPTIPTNKNKKKFNFVLFNAKRRKEREWTKRNF